MSDLIRVELPKGCILLLTSAEYRRASQGRGAQHRETVQKRMAKLRAERIAGKLAHDDTLQRPVAASRTVAP